MRRIKRANHIVKVLYLETSTIHFQAAHVLQATSSQGSKVFISPHRLLAPLPRAHKQVCHAPELPYLPCRPTPYLDPRHHAIHSTEAESQYF